MAKYPYGNYSGREVQVLVEEYAELNYRRDRSFILIRMIDLDMSVKRLPPVEHQAVLLHGMFGYTTPFLGKLLGVSAETIRRRYIRGLDRLVTLMNGGV